MKKIVYLIVFIFWQVSFGATYKLPSDEEVMKTSVEIAAMAAKDQEIRFQLLRLQKKFGANYVTTHPSYFKTMRAIDEKNSVKIRTILERYGWIDAKRFGEKCSHQTWLLLQHADHDIALQKMGLALLTENAKTNKKLLKSYAYLFDRIQMNQNRPQRYGTQGKCVKANDWQPYKIEDLTHIDSVRHSVGLEPFSRYQKSVAQFCFGRMK